MPEKGLIDLVESAQFVTRNIQNFKFVIAGKRSFGKVTEKTE